MTNKEILYLKCQIDKVKVVSFDVFDTLLFRVVNQPESIFDIMEENLKIDNFAQMRVEFQSKASQKLEREKNIPHADIHEIYEYFKCHSGLNLNWEQIEQYEVNIEGDALFANTEMKEIYQYAKDKGKRVIVVSDMYLLRNHLKRYLNNAGYKLFDEYYVSADEHKTKYSGDLFEEVNRREAVQPHEILHIGDNLVSDVKNAQKYGVKTYHYVNSLENENNEHTNYPIGQGVLKGLINEENDFWYNLGVKVGGPLYLGIYSWFLEKIKSEVYDKIFFLSRDGYILYNICKEQNIPNIEYMYSSRRALLMAGITELDEESLQLLPPFTFGQSVREVLEYLGVEETCNKGISECGFSSVDDIVRSMDDINKVKKIFVYNKAAFLHKCQVEREHALQYFKSIGFIDAKAIVFDCGWNGSSQFLLERFLRAVNYREQNKFFYVGIRNSEKSKQQLRNLEYETYLFDINKNIEMQDRIMHAVVLFELFFGAPHESVWYYGEEGPVFEVDDSSDNRVSYISKGCMDYVSHLYDFINKYDIHITEEQSVYGIDRLVNIPTQEEAITIGNLKNIDGFVSSKNEIKYISNLSLAAYLKNPKTEIYWIQGLLTRDDISWIVKKLVSHKYNISLSHFKKGKIQKVHIEAINNNTIFYRIARKLVRPLYHYLKRKLGKKEILFDCYKEWISKYEKDNLLTEQLEYNPLISVVIPVYNVENIQLKECIDSIINQTYTNWELCLVDDASTWDSVHKILATYESNPKIKIVYRKENGHISKSTNDGIAIATGEFIAFSDCDDVLAPNALYEMALKLNENREYDFIYSDEDKLSEDGKNRHSPFFKPDWSPDTFMSIMYTNHLAMYRRTIVNEVGGLRSEYNGAQDYDFTLRFMEKSDNKKVGHIPKVLYYWRERGESIASNPKAKPYALEAVKNAKIDALLRRGLKGNVVYVKDMFQYRVEYINPLEPLVSIVIPSKDNYEMLKRCILSLINKTSYKNYDIIVIDNGSNMHNKKLIEELCNQEKIDYYHNPMEFNFSRMCNLGASYAKGDYVLFLNDDIEIFKPRWLELMVGHASLNHIGAVGAKLYYPNSSRIQHAGILNLAIGPSHELLNFQDDNIYYFGRNRVEYNCIAVTGACLLVKKEKFNLVGGFDEKLTVGYNDVDLCFKLYKAGFYNVIRNDVILYHYESASRGLDDQNSEKMKRLMNERNLLYKKHEELKGRDPFYNINLVKNKVNFEINIEDSNQYSSLEVFSIKNKNKVQRGNILYSIDQIDVSSTISITGWAFIPHYSKNNFTKLSILLISPYGERYKVATKRLPRLDVENIYTDTKNNMYSGFQCIFNENVLNLSDTKYEIGIYIESPMLHKGNLCMTGKILKKPKSSDEDTVSKPLYKEVSLKHLVAGQNICCIDHVKVTDKVKIEGWIVDKLSMYNDDFYRNVLLISEQGKIIEVDSIRKRRLDIVNSMIEYPNNQFAGFDCTIKTESLRKYGTFFKIGAIMKDMYSEECTYIITDKSISLS